MYFEKTWNEKIHTNTAIAFKNVNIFFSNAHIFFPTKIETKSLFLFCQKLYLRQEKTKHFEANFVSYPMFSLFYYFLLFCDNHKSSIHQTKRLQKIQSWSDFFFSIELILSLMNGTVYICATNFYAFFPGFHSSLHEILVIFQSSQNSSYWIKILYTKFIMGPFVRFGRPSCHSNSSQLHLRYVKLFFGLEKNKKTIKIK